MKVSSRKTVYMCVNKRNPSGTVRLQGAEMKKVGDFKYLGSTVQSNGECGKEMKKHVQTDWNGWRKLSGLMCDKRVSARMKRKVQDSGESHLETCTEEKTGGRVGVLFGSDEDG